jgi:hypothetical protein
MKELWSMLAGLLITVGLGSLSACKSQPSAPPSTGSRAAGSEPAQAPETHPVWDLRSRWRDQKPEEFEAAWRLVDKAVAAMGGTAVVDGVKTLVLTGKVLQRSPLGEYTAAVTTTILYPASVRRDVTLPTGGTVSSVFTPEGTFMTGALGTFELGQAERDRLEASAMRIPISLLKSRYHRLFRASVGAPPPPGVPGEAFHIRIATQETEVLLDAEGRIVQVSYEGTSPFDASKKEHLRVVYSEFRNVTGLTFPFASEGWIGEEKVSTGQLDSVRVNEAVPAELFTMPSREIAPAPTPTVR